MHSKHSWGKCINPECSQSQETPEHPAKFVKGTACQRCGLALESVDLDPAVRLLRKMARAQAAMWDLSLQLEQMLHVEFSTTDDWTCYDNATYDDIPEFIAALCDDYEEEE